jgi:hypothetical protein
MAEHTNARRHLMTQDLQPQDSGTEQTKAPQGEGELADEQLEQVVGGLSLPGFGKVVINHEEQ